MDMNKLLYGVAYYDEYMPYERLSEDIRMMKAAGINVVRIAESTWSTLEPQSGVFDFTHIDRVLEGMYANDIHVIIGTPTYAVPTWMVKEHPEVLATTINGHNKYGPRQNMDITNPTYLFYAERVIRALMAHAAKHPGVIGYQVDNETKHYNTLGPNVQHQFIKYIKNRFESLEAMNTAYGLDYWSNRINAWEDFPSVEGTINPSLRGAFSEFQRSLVTDFLAWQATIIREYSLETQFITHNFDFDWRGFSYGIQPDVDHFEASKALDIVGVDIYHPSQEELTGIEIAFCGDVARSLKHDNYMVLETEAQGFASWVPLPGQLRLQAFSHIASGALMVAYWHWHSIHNSAETYWKGLLSHDFDTNPTYEEAMTIGQDFMRLSPMLQGLTKKNEVALLVSNKSLTALSDYKTYGQNIDYNDQVRQVYDVLYKMNIECDFIPDTADDYSTYKLLVVPALYVASDEALSRLNTFVENGGHILYTMRSGFSNEHVQVRTSQQPGIITQACGVTYSQFIESKGIGLVNHAFLVDPIDNVLSNWMELLTVSDSTRVLSTYDHKHWGTYAAITQNTYGKGMATYIGCSPSKAIIEEVLKIVINQAQLLKDEETIVFPIIRRQAINQLGQKVEFIFNYSDDRQEMIWKKEACLEAISMQNITKHDTITLKPWGIKILISL